MRRFSPRTLLAAASAALAAVLLLIAGGLARETVFPAMTA
jgi:hypothetical protein